MFEVETKVVELIITLNDFGAKSLHPLFDIVEKDQRVLKNVGIDAQIV